MTTYGLLIFDGAEELDFAGPWEVFTVSAMLRDHGDTAVLIAQRPGAVRCGKGMQVLPGFIFNDHPPLDVLLVPGAWVPAARCPTPPSSIGLPRCPLRPRG
jgi:transcriptional regulator GlxA family with amidase domain